eukprot:13716935-Alexandrium_andersonii.AAC.1
MSVSSTTTSQRPSPPSAVRNLRGPEGGVAPRRLRWTCFCDRGWTSSAAAGKPSGSPATS